VAIGPHRRFDQQRFAGLGGCPAHTTSPCLPSRQRTAAGPPQCLSPMGPGRFDRLPAAHPPAGLGRLEALPHGQQQCRATEQSIIPQARRHSPGHRHRHQQPGNSGKAAAIGRQQRRPLAKPAAHPDRSAPQGAFGWGGSGRQSPPATHRGPVLVQARSADQGNDPHRHFGPVLCGLLRLPLWCPAA